MTMNPLAPQAYTQETLRQAYSWIMSQPDHLKEMATTPEILISLYSKYRSQGIDSLDRPSIQNFKNELKSLAGMMGELNSNHANPADPAQVAANQKQAPAAATAAEPNLASLKLDEVSLKAIRQVKETLNLSSDTEAVRALIAIGIKKFQQGQF
jgi:hypothetical protein